MIDRDKYPDCNIDPVPDSPKGPCNYGDRIGTRNNQLRIGDVAVKESVKVDYDSCINVTIQASDTNGHGTIDRNMRVRDIMNEKSDSILVSGDGIAQNGLKELHKDLVIYISVILILKRFLLKIHAIIGILSNNYIYPIFCNLTSMHSQKFL